MPRKRSARDDAEASKPKQLRKRLRKAEDQLDDAQLKRDRAQARVEALSIIADEIRAQLAEADKAAEEEAAVVAEALAKADKPAAKATAKPAAAKEPAAARKPAAPKLAAKVATSNADVVPAVKKSVSRKKPAEPGEA